MSTGSGIMTIFFYKGLTRNFEIENTPVWVLPNIWKLGQVMDTKCRTDVSNRNLLNAGKFQGYSFYGFWVIKGKPTGGGWNPNPPPPPLTHTHTHTQISVNGVQDCSLISRNFLLLLLWTLNKYMFLTNKV